MTRRVEQADRLAVIGRHGGLFITVFLQRIIEIDQAVIRHLHHHLAGHQLTDGRNADQRIRPWLNTISGRVSP